MLKKYIVDLMSDNPLNGISTYKDILNLATGVVTRYIKKLVLDGTENWTKTENDDKSFFNWYIGTATIQDIGLCSHFPYGGVTSGSTTIGVLMTSGGSLRIRPNNVSSMTLTEFTTWLSTQYANGTPVTVWYVLATAETNTITIPTGLSGTVEGYTTQTGTPTPTNPIYPTANNVTMWANYTPQKYSGTAWQAATGQPEQYNGGWT